MVIAIAALVLFGYKKLPDMSRSVGRSLRIFKSEMKGLNEDDAARDNKAEAAPPTVAVNPEPTVAVPPVAAPAAPVVVPPTVVAPVPVAPAPVAPPAGVPAAVPPASAQPAESQPTSGPTA
ncbi:twin-arginine translocase TatA/TatE family subunit [Jatrophihabitans telluris]|uniref:Sec-independent protein translocase protein TatA n=2 Tax=Jatrophihabitans telluris TaxID=2038343 RepID=A0ABY4R4F1_9ACTN|nr:twin-arginine translocase TatA/TatE family subunit [Jatrophihabitans telluris]